VIHRVRNLTAAVLALVLQADVVAEASARWRLPAGALAGCLAHDLGHRPPAP
jgi:hypothetical protein